MYQHCGHMMYRALEIEEHVRSEHLRNEHVRVILIA